MCDLSFEIALSLRNLEKYYKIHGKRSYKGFLKVFRKGIAEVLVITDFQFVTVKNIYRYVYIYVYIYTFYL